MNDMKKSRGNLLLEFFSEEIPARMQLNSETQLQNLFIKSLKKRDIAFESFKIISETLVGRPDYTICHGSIKNCENENFSIQSHQIGLYLLLTPGDYKVRL